MAALHLRLAVLCLALSAPLLHAGAVLEYKPNSMATLPVHFSGLNEFVAAYWSNKSRRFPDVYNWWSSRTTDFAKRGASGFDGTLTVDLVHGFQGIETTLFVDSSRPKYDYLPSVAENRLFDAVVQMANQEVGRIDPAMIECAVVPAAEGSFLVPVSALRFKVRYQPDTFVEYEIQLLPNKDGAEALPGLEIFAFRSTSGGAPRDPANPYVGLISLVGGERPTKPEKCL